MRTLIVGAAAAGIAALVTGSVFAQSLPPLREATKRAIEACMAQAKPTPFKPADEVSWNDFWYEGPHLKLRTTEAGEYYNRHCAKIADAVQTAALDK